jgi:hypothetical protein
MEVYFMPSGQMRTINGYSAFFSILYSALFCPAQIIPPMRFHSFCSFLLRNQRRPIQRFVLGCLLLLYCCLPLLAQEGRPEFPKRNALYVEAFGKAPYYSVNYDRIVRVGAKWSYSLRAGFSIVADGISMPLGFNAFTTPGHHHLEWGLGLTPYIDHYRTFLAEKDESDKQLYIVPHIGYRYQKPEGGLFFTAGVMPTVFIDPPSTNVWDFTPEFRVWGGLALGVSF